MLESKYVFDKESCHKASEHCSPAVSLFKAACEDFTPQDTLTKREDREMSRRLL